MAGRWIVAAGLALAGLAALRCSLAPEMRLVPTNRVVLAELFTWQRCSYCPYAARALESLAAEMADSLIVIAYHRRMLGDTLSPSCVEGRRALYYESGGEPATVFDGGVPVRTTEPGENLAVFRAHALAARGVRPLAQLRLAAALDSLRGVVTTVVSGVDSTPVETLRLFIVVVEDGVRATLSGATDTVFNRVMRAMLPDSAGRPLLLAPGESVAVADTFAAPSHWNPGRLRLVAFVQQPSTRAILQAAQVVLESQRR